MPYREPIRYSKGMWLMMILGAFALFFILYYIISIKNVE